MTTVFIGMGSNMGDRMDNLSQALVAIAALPSTHVENVSNAYESVPAYVEGQGLFYNAVVEVSTGLEADTLLDHLLEVERALGRVRDVDKGPRVIDLDLLLFGDEEWSSPRLTLPHPGIAERDFVVTPLLEIAPRTVLPDGTHLKRSEARVGDVLRDVGPIPDIAACGESGLEPGEWVEVAASETTADRIAGFDASLQLKSGALEQECIPYTWDPHEPGTDMDPFGMPMIFKLLVPVIFEERARALLASIEAAPLLMPGDEVPGPASDRDPGMVEPS